MFLEQLLKAPNLVLSDKTISDTNNVKFDLEKVLPKNVEYEKSEMFVQDLKIYQVCLMFILKLKIYEMCLRIILK